MTDTATPALADLPLPELHKVLGAAHRADDSATKTAVWGEIKARRTAAWAARDQRITAAQAPVVPVA